MIKQVTREFVANIQGIEGWLFDDNIYVTGAIFNAMAKAGVRGPNFEIGVYKAKYLSAIHHCASVYLEPTLTVGLDTFQWTTEEDSRDTWTKLFGNTAGLRLVRGDSTKTRPDEIIEACGGLRPAFISIDGDHTAGPVLNDHMICAAALVPGGVMASDDFCNGSILGVMDGISRFFISNNQHDIVPFAFCQYKLFSCHAAFHDRYVQALLDFCDTNRDLPAAQRFYATARAQGDHWTQWDLFGAKCLVL